MATARVNDLDIVYDIAGPVGAPPVLMINGLGAARAGWALQVPALAERYRVITFDNRDVGQTGPGENPGFYPMRQFADDAAGLLDVLGIERAHVIGASMGGTIAQELVLSHPDRVRSAQIVCSWAKTDPWFADLLTQWEAVYEYQGPLAWSHHAWLVVYTWRAYRDPKFLPNAERDVLANEYPQSFDSFRRQVRAAREFDVLGRLGRVDTPIHVIVGDEDLLTPPRFSRQIAAAIPGAELTVFPEVGHGLFWEKTDEFNRALLSFLDRQP